MQDYTQAHIPWDSFAIAVLADHLTIYGQPHGPRYIYARHIAQVLATGLSLFDNMDLACMYVCVHACT